MEKLDSMGSRLVGEAYGEMGAPFLEWRGRPLMEEDRMGTACDRAYPPLQASEAQGCQQRGQPWAAQDRTRFSWVIQGWWVLLGQALAGLPL